MSYVQFDLLNATYTDVQIFVNKFISETYNIFVILLQFLSISDESQLSVKFSYTQIYESIVKFLLSFVQFDDFQIKLLKVLISFFICNLLIILILWHFLGRQICDRFMRPATSRAIEELKASVARLKLPKVHSPRN